MEQMTNKYPVGIQTFSEIIRGGYVYIDKTDLIWDLVHYAKFIFMSRPRRFGKSLLTSTIESYFSGDRTLFKGLKIEGLEKEWSQYPVIHLDLSVAKGQTDASELRETLMWMMQPFADLYGHKDNETSPGKLLTGVMKRASEKAGTQVKCSQGRADLVVSMPDAVYVLELKVGGSAADALRQIDSKGYAIPYKADGRRVVKVGVSFNKETRTVDDWIVEE